MTAILEFPAPESCNDCPLSRDDDSVALYGYQERYCYNDVVVTHNTTSLHPDCPLRISEVIKSKTIDGVETELLIPPENILDELKEIMNEPAYWINEKETYSSGEFCYKYFCPECSKRSEPTKYCSRCGTKLLRPEVK